MKTKLFLGSLILLGMLLSSCDPNELNNTGNYWERNSLSRMQLRGNVKSLTTNNDERVILFNERGFITSNSFNSGTYSSSETYTYASNGQLISKTSVNSGQSTNNTATETFEYGTHGKYIPSFGFHMPEGGLIPNLKAIIGEESRTDYIFKGDDLYIIYTNLSDNKKDTTAIIKFSGKYPHSTSTNWSFAKDMTYAGNGMFKTYTEGFHGDGYRNSRIHKFMDDKDYMLLESVTYIDVQGTETTTHTRTLTYNDKKDVITDTEDEYVQEYYDYVYDAQGNWTSRKYRYKNPEWSTPQTEIRVIQYWTSNTEKK